MKAESRSLLVAVLTGSAFTLAQAQSTERVSVDSAGVQGNKDSLGQSISGDGRFIAFASAADNLVPGDSNGVSDVFVRDRLSGTTERVSVDSSGAEANGSSWDASLSADGNYVVFISAATNLVPGGTSGIVQVFVHDRQLGNTELVSVNSSGVEGGLESWHPSISSDGRFVAFATLAENFSYWDHNFLPDVILRDRLNGTTWEVTVVGFYNYRGGGDGPSISADGRYVAFTSIADDLVAGDTNGVEDVFVWARLTGTFVRASVSSSGAQGNASSGHSATSISANGRYVAFTSDATNLVSGDTNGFTDIFVRDRVNGTTERVSVDSSAVQGNCTSGPDFSISADGRCVTFDSCASNLVPGDTNGLTDVFLHNRQTGVTELVSVDTSGAQGNRASEWPSTSADGRFVAFDSSASDFVAGDTNGVFDVFARDRGALPVVFCPGDGSAGNCPCSPGATWRGCANSATTAGAFLAAAGNPSLAQDTLTLTSTGELPSALSVLLQGDTQIAPVRIGDGLRCVGGSMKRLYFQTASAGSVSAPQPGDPSISARSAALGDVISAGSTRYYQTYYRDTVITYCPIPFGNSWNISSGLAVTWN